MSRKSQSSVLAAMVGITVARPASRADTMSRRTRCFDEAMSMMEDGRWEASFARLAELADDGHAPAARMALMFVQRGTSLFGGTFHASAQQRERWQRASV